LLLTIEQHEPVNPECCQATWNNYYNSKNTSCHTAKSS